MARFKLISDEQGLGLHDRFSSQKPLRVDFAAPEFLRRLAAAGRRSELVARAARAGPARRVLDATAGLGRDAFLLAYLGCEVCLVERSATLARLLADGLDRAAADSRLAAAVSRIALRHGDGTAAIADAGPLDVIYLDPMFPEKSGSALVGGDMQKMQRFLGTDDDVLQLLETALTADCERVVLKRPARSDWLSPVKPDLVLKSKTSLFEVYLKSQ